MKDSKQTPPKLDIGSYPHSTSEDVMMASKIEGKSDWKTNGGSYNRGKQSTGK